MGGGCRAERKSKEESKAVCEGKGGGSFAYLLPSWVEQGDVLSPLRFAPLLSLYTIPQHAVFFVRQDELSVFTWVGTQSLGLQHGVYKLINSVCTYIYMYVHLKMVATNF